MSSIPSSLSQTSRWPKAIRSLGYRNFRLYWTGQIISQVGTWLQIVAQGWVVYNLTDSPLMLGLVNFAALLPVVPISLLAGVLSDRFSRKYLIMISEIVMMVQALIMALLLWLNIIQVWHVIVLSLILGAASAIEQPARLAFVVDVVGKDDLSNAVALNASATNAARIIGPAIAGVIIAAIGEAMCFFINGISYLAVILALVAVRIPWKAKEKGALRVAVSLKDGFLYLKENRVVQGLLLVVSLASFLTIPYIALMPVFARDILNVGSVGLGYLLTAVGIGAIIGALLVARQQAGRRGEWLMVANFLGPIFLVGFSFSSNFTLSLALVVIVGAFNAVRLTLGNSLTQLNTADDYHGRMMSLFNLLFNGMSRVGALVIGGFAEIISVSWAMGISAAISAMIGLILLFRMPGVRRLE